MGFGTRLLLKFTLGVVSHPWRTLIVSAVILAGCIALATMRLGISTDQNKLFSPDVPFFRDYLEFDRKFPENEAIYVVVEPADARATPPVARWTDLADRIAANLQQIPQHVQSVDWRVSASEMGAQGILYDSPAMVRQSLEDAKQFAPLVKLWAEPPNAATGLLGGSPIERFITALGLAPQNAQADSFVAALADSWRQSLKNPDLPLAPGQGLPDLAALDASDPSRLGYYYVADESAPGRHVLLVRVYPQEHYDSLTAISETVDEIRAACARAAAAFPEFRVGVTGRPALAADEMRTTDRDSTRAEILALSAIFVGLVLGLRSVWLALAAELTLAVAIGWSFGWATLSIGELNLLSLVFLIALIGIGMDYLIQVIAAYRREARRYVRARAIWARVFRHVGPPTLTACAGAAGAFLVSALTEFRGAAELGIIAGGGLLLCLLAGYTVLPALLVIRPPKLKPLHASHRYSATASPRRGWRRLAWPALWLILLIAGIPFMLRAHFNPNLLELQAPNLESVKLVRKLQTWSAVVLSKDIKTLQRARSALADLPTVASTESILQAYDNYDWLQKHKGEMPAIQWSAPQPIDPKSLPRLAAKLKLLADRMEPTSPQAAAALRPVAEMISTSPPAQHAAIAQRLSQWQVAFLQELQRLMAQLSPPPPDAAALPPALRNHLLSPEGDWALYIYPREDLWQQQALARFVTSIDHALADLPGRPAATGIAHNIHYTTASIERAFYKATFYALGLIFLLVWLDLRNLAQTLLTISVLGLGLPMLVALMGLLDVSWNFANFFALPILIGAGHEYGVFMMHRYREVIHDPRRAWPAWDVADRALLLCAFVTSSSFAFFWALGHHEGLRSLGLVMAVGSACIYLATVLAVRPILKWRLERRFLDARQAKPADND